MDPDLFFLLFPDGSTNRYRIRPKKGKYKETLMGKYLIKI